ncbi:MAG: hypothetical protein PHC61_08770 [Chitinivibrionales bacterium]|nr:hypothetical protein [Chitinivibrionales bacterium]
MNVNKNAILKTDKNGPGKPGEMKKSEALSFVGELSEEIFSLTGRYDVKSRLQRNVVIVNRKQR